MQQKAMDTTGRIMRRSIHTLLQNYHFFTNAPAFILLPLSLSILLCSQSLVSSSSFPLLPTIHARLRILFEAAGFPPYSRFFSLLTLKLSQTICSSMLTLPFTLSFLLIAKAAIIRALHTTSPSLSPSFSSFLPIYAPILFTYICNLFVVLSASSVSFFLVFLAFNSLDAYGFSSPDLVFAISAVGAILYSVVLAKAFIVCNMALIVSGMENCSSFFAVLKACVLIGGRNSTALSLALVANFGLASVEALFQYRVVRAYWVSQRISLSMASEGLLIAYLYSILLVLDTITSCLFYKSCKLCCWTEQEDVYHHNVQVVVEENDGTCRNSKAFQELP